MKTALSFALGIGILLSGFAALRHVTLNWRKAALYGGLTVALIIIATQVGGWLNQ